MLMLVMVAMTRSLVGMSPYNVHHPDTSLLLTFINMIGGRYRPCGEPKSFCHDTRIILVSAPYHPSQIKPILSLIAYPFFLYLNFIKNRPVFQVERRNPKKSVCIDAYITNVCTDAYCIHNASKYIES